MNSLKRALISFSFALFIMAHTSAYAQKKLLGTTLFTYDALIQLTKNIPNVDVSYIMGPGVDPHYYRPTTKDLRKIKKANLIVIHGLHLEGKMVTLFNQLKKRKKVVDLGETVSATQLLTPRPGEVDPHTWFDPPLWVKQIAAVSKELQQLFPNNAKKVQSNFNTWKKQVNIIYTQGKKQITAIPKARRILVTSHDAFNYFSRAFDIETMGIQGLSTTSEAGLKDMERVAALVKKRKVKAIFVESSVSHATIQRIADITKAKIGGELFSDSIGRLDTPEGTYIGALKHNIETLVKALK